MTKFILELQFWKHTLNINTQINKKPPPTHLFLPNPMIIKDTRTQQKNVDQNIVYIFDLLILLKIQFCSKLLLGLIRDFIITKTNQNEYQRKKKKKRK